MNYALSDINIIEVLSRYSFSFLLLFTMGNLVPLKWIRITKRETAMTSIVRSTTPISIYFPGVGGGGSSFLKRLFKRSTMYGFASHNAGHFLFSALGSGVSTLAAVFRTLILLIPPSSIFPSVQYFLSWISVLSVSGGSAMVFELDNFFDWFAVFLDWKLGLYYVYLVSLFYSFIWFVVTYLSEVNSSYRLYPEDEAIDTYFSIYASWLYRCTYIYVYVNNIYFYAKIQLNSMTFMISIAYKNLVVISFLTL